MKNIGSSEREAGGRGPAWSLLPRLPGFLLPLLFAFLPALPAAADPNPDNDSDAITVSVTPVVELGVELDTAAVDLNLTLQMGATGYTATPATVTVLGNVQPVEVDLIGANVSADPVWTLDADEVAETDQVQVYALFAVDRSSIPLEAEFAGVKNLLGAAAKRAGVLNGSGTNGNFENNDMTGGANMDNLAVGAQRQLWLRVDAPPRTGTDQPQKIQLTITATRQNR